MMRISILGFSFNSRYELGMNVIYKFGPILWDQFEKGHTKVFTN
jgi:hypothetical protein